MTQGMCPQCGAQFSATAFCTTCGADLRVQAGDQPQTDAWPVKESADQTVVRGAAPMDTGQQWQDHGSTVAQGYPLPEYSAPTQPSGRRGAGVWVAVLAALLLLLGVGTAGAWWLLKDDQPDSSASQSEPSSESSQSPTDEPGTQETTAPSDSPSPSPSVEPVPDGMCWNGRATVLAEKSCPPPTTEKAMKFAFPIDWSSCYRDSGAAYNKWSYTCAIQDAEIHIATYRSQMGRDIRLSNYGPCSARGGSRIVCPASATARRWVRTYDDGLMFYMSAPIDDRDVLLGLPMRSAAEVRNGVKQ